MNTFGRITNIALDVLTGFLALTAFAGGFGILVGWIAMPQEYLHGLFSGYLIPALCLFVLVGGSALAAFILLVRREDSAIIFAATSGIVIMFFEFVETQVIGTPAGPAQALQIFYFGLGTLIVIVSFVVWMLMMRFRSA